MDGRPAVRSLSRARGAVLARLSKRECSSLAERPQIRRFAILPSVVLTHDPLPWHVEVPDYEAILEELKLQIKEDPLVDLLEFPPDDISVQSKPRQNRAATCFPEGTSEKESGNLLVEECLKTYNSPENLVCYNYKDYSGDFQHLPKVDLQRHFLVPHVYEVDLDTDKEEENGGVASQMAIVLKKGWLHKGNFTNSSNSVTMKNSRIRRHGFEVKMVDGGGLLLAAESASDMDGWRSTLNSLLQSHFHAAMKADNP
uniref:Dedicator of cytokinesis C/D N-terminal domain-containing protein n=1 Tax=Eptatretus burgeri TaxID=7764 RepID=A0A8C4WZQ6_EPTBU